MPETIPNDEQGRAPTSSQSGLQVWLACTLFILVPLFLILVVKYMFGI